MAKYFSIFDLVVFLGIIQGIVFGALLSFGSQRFFHNRFLIFLLAAFSILSGKILLHTLNLWEGSLAYFPLSIDLATPPLLYFYIRSVTGSKFKVAGKQLVHFVPFAALLIFSIVVYLMVLPEMSLAAKDMVASRLFYFQVKEIEDLLMIISVGFYLTQSFRELSKVEDDKTRNENSQMYSQTIWLVWFLRGCVLLAVLFCVGLGIDHLLDLGSNYFFHWKIFYVCLTLLLYFLGIGGYRHALALSIHEGTIEKPSERIKKVGEEASEEIGLRLEAMFSEDKIHRNADLSLKILAEKLDSSESRVSYVINQRFNKSFRELINEYRIEDVLAAFQEERYDHLSLAGLAFEFGFNSESSFYRILKKHTGKSPRELRLIARNQD